MNWNHYIDDIKNHLVKFKNAKLNFQDLDAIIAIFDNIVQAKLHISLYEKIFQYFVQFFIIVLPLLPYDHIYRCFRGLLEFDSPQIKNKKAYYLIKSVVQSCQNVENPDQKNLKLVFILIKKAAQKQYGPETMNVFIEYYIERIKEIEKVKTIHFSIISQIFSILLPKYKLQTTQIIKNMLGNNYYFTVFVLLEGKQYPSFFLPLIHECQKKITFPKFVDDPEIKIQLMKIFSEFFYDTLKAGLFQFIIDVFALCPKKKIKTIDDLYDHIIMQILKQNQKQKNSVIMSQNIKANFSEYLKRNENNTENLKLFAILCYLFSDNDKIHPDLMEFLQEFENQQMLEEYLNVLGLLKQTSQKIDLNGIKKEFMQIQKQKSFLYSGGDMDVDPEEVFDFRQWKRILSFIFQETANYNLSKSPEQNENLFPELSEEVFFFYSIKPRGLQNKKQKNESVFNLDPIFKNSLKILAKIVENNSIKQVSEQIRKLMQYYYEKVNESIIRANIGNIFFCKCVLLTNSQIKGKTIFDIVCRMQEHNPKALRKDLSLLIPSVNEEVIIEYGNFIVSKDKPKFKLQLFQKQLTKYEYLCEQNVSELIEPIYVQL